MGLGLGAGLGFELSQYFRHSLLSVASNSPHSCCSGMLSGMLKRAMMTHLGGEWRVVSSRAMRTHLGGEW